MLFQPWFIFPYGAAWLLQEFLAWTSDVPFLWNFLVEYQHRLLEFLFADLGVVFCLTMFWGMQVLFN